jgi:hypothetical protein
LTRRRCQDGEEGRARQVAAARVADSARILTGANLIRQAAGLSAEQTADQSRAETAAAFEQLASGLGSFGT